MSKLPLTSKDIKRMSGDQIDDLIRVLMLERTQRAIDFGDPDTLINRALSQGFSITGDPVQPKDMGNGIVAITGVVKDTSNQRHRCNLYSIRVGDDERFNEYWAWDEDSPSFIAAETSKVDAVRRSVSLHSLPDEALIIEHSMVHDGERHERKSVKAYRVKHVPDYETGEILSTTIEKESGALIKRLPPPPSSAEV